MKFAEIKALAGNGDKHDEMFLEAATSVFKKVFEEKPDEAWSPEYLHEWVANEHGEDEANELFEDEFKYVVLNQEQLEDQTVADWQNEDRPYFILTGTLSEGHDPDAEPTTEMIFGDYEKETVTEEKTCTEGYKGLKVHRLPNARQETVDAKIDSLNS